MNNPRLMSVLLEWILSKDSHTVIFCTTFTVLSNTEKQKT